MAGVRKQQTSSGKYRGWFTNKKGGQTFFTGTTNSKETEQMAISFEDDHRRQRMGFPAKIRKNLKLKKFLATVNAMDDFRAEAKEYLFSGGVKV